MTRRLRIGVMLDGWDVPAWIARVFDTIDAADVADVVLVVMNAEKRRWPEKVRALPRHALYSAYLRADQKLMQHVGPRQDDAFARVSLAQRFAHLPVRDVTPQRIKFSQRFAEADVSAIKDANVDVMLRFGFGILRGDVLHAARYGIWSYHHGDNRAYRGGPPQFWEMAEDSAVSGVTLQVLGEKLDGGRVLARCVQKTNGLSLHLNRNLAYWKGAPLVARQLRTLARDPDAFAAAGDASSAPYTRGIYKMPSNAAMTRFIGRLAVRGAQRALQDARSSEAWFIAYKRAAQTPSAIAASWYAERDDPAHVLHAPRGAYFADPFLLRRSDHSLLFFEHFVHADNKAHISVVTVDDDGIASDLRTAFAPSHHVSYPFVFEADGAVFMVPESRANGRVELWRARKLPDDWQREAVLLHDVSAVDATIVQRDGLWWLFASVAPQGASSSDELHAYWSTQLTGPYQPHALNPIVADVRCARPAGAWMQDSSRWVRPAQDSARVYGHRVVFQEVTTLTPTTYAEQTTAALGPDWCAGNIGTHSFHSDGVWMAVDGRTLQRRELAEVAGRVTRTLRRWVS